VNETALLSIGREALLLMVVASAPPLLSSLVAGALFSALQAITSIQESTLSVVPKLMAAILSLVIAQAMRLNVDLANSLWVTSNLFAVVWAPLVLWVARLL